MREEGMSVRGEGGEEERREGLEWSGVRVRVGVGLGVGVGV